MYTKNRTLKTSDLRKHTHKVLREIQKVATPITVFSRSTPEVVIMSLEVYEGLQQGIPHNAPSASQGKGIGFFIDPPKEVLIQGKGIDAVKEIQQLRGKY